MQIDVEFESQELLASEHQTNFGIMYDSIAFSNFLASVLSIIHKNAMGIPNPTPYFQQISSIHVIVSEMAVHSLDHCAHIV